ncbi:MAG: hypothetical protein NZ551_03155 [Microscillaceae bacterium]|nr:hypothetical protein [Microscillaceae bacterium]MDW8460186.1 hypothetical protein [Cytophagales bacterium]
MKINKLQFWFGLLWTLGLCLGLTYIFLLRSEVVLIYQGKPSAWAWLVDWFYPRFWVEKQRFPLEFFLAKTDNILLRLALVLFVYSVGFYYLSQPRPKRQWQRFWQLALTANEAKWLSRIIVMLCVWASHTWAIDLTLYSEFPEFYKPIFLLKILKLPLLSAEGFYFLWGLMLISFSLTALLGSYSLIFSLIAMTNFVLLQGYLHSFHKIDHPYVPLTFLVMLLPALVYQIQQSQFENLWTIRLMQVSIASLYFLAGAEKILIGGLAWFHPLNLQTHAQMHQAEWGMWLFAYEPISTLCSIFAVAIELTFPLIFYFPRFKWLFLGLGICLHLGIFLLLEVGIWLSPWVWSYVVFYKIRSTDLETNA